MIKWGKEYKPYKVEFKHTAKGDATVFCLAQYHKSQNGDFIGDGFVQIWANELYKDFADGDTIIIHAEDTLGLDRRTIGQFVNMTLFCRKVEIKTKADKKAEPNKAILDEDIPDDLF